MVSNSPKRKSKSLNDKNDNASADSEKIPTPEKSEMNSPGSSSVPIGKEEPKNEKKIWSFQALVETMKPSNEELEFRNKISKESDVLKKDSKSFTCTKCNKNFNPDSTEGEKVQIHPCLGVLMCQSCCDYYENGEFSLDSDGEDKYCRWCGEGGTIFGCSKCICGFCVICIKKHFGLKYLKKVKDDDDWQCFFCNPKPLWKHRYICSLAVQMSEKKADVISRKSSTTTENTKKGSVNNQKNSQKRTKSKKKEVTKENCQVLNDSDSSTDVEMLSIKSLVKKDDSISMKRVYTSSDEATEIEMPVKKKLKLSKKSPKKHSQKEENFENLKQTVLEKLERILKLSEYQLAFGVNWSSKLLKKLADPKHITSKEILKGECEKIKWFFSVLSTYLVEFCNTVDSVEKNLQKENGLKDSGSFPQQMADPTGFSTIMQFLAFVTSQVKTFMEKGLSLPDVLKAEIYDDNKVIGIKKKLSESSGNASQTGSVNSEKNSEGTSRITEAEEPRVEDDESRDEDSLRLRIDQSSQEGDEDCADLNSSGGTSVEKNCKGLDRKEEILQILEILENA